MFGARSRFVFLVYSQNSMISSSFSRTAKIRELNFPFAGRIYLRFSEFNISRLSRLYFFSSAYFLSRHSARQIQLLRPRLEAN